MGEPKVYQASRFTGGNFFFPDRLRLEQDAVVFEKRKLIGGQEEAIRYDQIASVSVQRGLVFADLLFETTGGSEPVFLNGLWGRHAERAKLDLQARIRSHSTEQEDRVVTLLEEQNQLLQQVVGLLERRA